MANLKITPAGSSASALSHGSPFQDVTSTNPATPKPMKAAVVLPEDMAGWLSTREVAEYLGISRRQFQDFANKRDLPKKKLGLSAFYSPDVVESARREWKKIKAAPKATQSAPKKMEGATVREKVSGVSPATDDPFYNNALALIGQIVQQRGREKDWARR